MANAVSSKAARPVGDAVGGLHLAPYAGLLVPRQLNHRPFQLLADHLQAQESQRLYRLDPRIRIGNQIASGASTVPISTDRLTRFFRTANLLTAGSSCWRYKISLRSSRIEHNDGSLYCFNQHRDKAANAE